MNLVCAQKGKKINLKEFAQDQNEVLNNELASLSGIRYGNEVAMRHGVPARQGNVKKELKDLNTDSRHFSPIQMAAQRVPVDMQGMGTNKQAVFALVM